MRLPSLTQIFRIGRTEGIKIGSKGEEDPQEGQFEKNLESMKNSSQEGTAPPPHKFCVAISPL
jgi:hypothetical protein